MHADSPQGCTPLWPVYGCSDDAFHPRYLLTGASSIRSNTPHSTPLATCFGSLHNGFASAHACRHAVRRGCPHPQFPGTPHRTGGVSPVFDSPSWLVCVASTRLARRFCTPVCPPHDDRRIVRERSPAPSMRASLELNWGAAMAAIGWPERWPPLFGRRDGCLGWCCCGRLQGCTPVEMGVAVRSN